MTLHKQGDKPLNTVNSLRKHENENMEPCLKLKASDDEQLLLFIASGNGQPTIVRSLLDHGPDVNEEYYKCLVTVLHRASYNGTPELVKLLIERDAHVNLRNITGQTPRHVASSYGHLEVTRLLLDHGADVNMQRQGRGRPCCMSHRQWGTSILLNSLECGAEVDVRRSSGRTLRQAAIAFGHHRIAEFLSECGTSL